MTEFRHILLMNADVKHLVKIVVDRLKIHVGDLLQQDRVGFMLGREGRDNSIQALSLIHRAKIQRRCLNLLSDAEKTFDCINWIFKDEILKALGLDTNMLSWIALL